MKSMRDAVFLLILVLIVLSVRITPVDPPTQGSLVPAAQAAVLPLEAPEMPAQLDLSGLGSPDSAGAVVAGEPRGCGVCPGPEHPAGVSPAAPLAPASTSC